MQDDDDDELDLDVDDPAIEELGLALAPKSKREKKKVLEPSLCDMSLIYQQVT